METTPSGTSHATGTDTGSAPAAPAAPAAVTDGEAAALPVLGMIGYGRLAAFSRLAQDAAAAPDLQERLALSGFAGAALARLDQVAERVAEIGGDLEPVMRPFAGALVEFEERTEASTWWERLLKGYVGYGVSDDFARIVAGGLDPVTRDVVEEAVADRGYATWVVDELAAACADDATLAPRLALWGRRLVGEALGAVQRVLVQHPELLPLLELAQPGQDPAQRLFSALTAEHTRRMDRLGLAA
jgi:hypothetical protein